ncbi:hypothetical protein D3C71_1991690 [compost metagenome]
MGHRSEVAFEGQRNRLNPEFDSAYRCRREQRTLLRLELGDVVINDGREVLGSRHPRQPGLDGGVVVRGVHHFADD